ncbi:MAG: hypothetical protein K9K32_05885 [Halanaerobiales bacterium]|nr:hypothetical protein [Halanaerobiales bacterium]
MSAINHQKQELDNRFNEIKSRIDYALSVMNSPKPEIKQAEKDVLIETYQYLNYLQESILRYMAFNEDD